jgi:diguanylate cyclase (GGDEF)-like protein
MVNKKTILIVDDVPFEVRRLTSILSELANLKVATSGEDCFGVLSRGPIDLILLDVVMTGMSGFDVLEKLSQHDTYKKIPVILITNLVTTEDEVKGFVLGAVDFIRKPFEENVVKHRVLRSLKYQEMFDALNRIGVTDALTGISNRRGFDETLAKEWGRAKRLNMTGDRYGIGVLLADIDFFKRINDTYGHPDGDRTLSQLGKLLKETFQRATDFVARFGGEEFIVLLSGTTKSDYYASGVHLVEAVRHTSVRLEKHVIDITCTVGGSFVYPAKGGISSADLLKLADNALYKGKQDGRDRFICSEKL